MTLRSELAESARLLRESGGVKVEPQPKQSPSDSLAVRFKSLCTEVRHGRSVGSVERREERGEIVCTMTIASSSLHNEQVTVEWPAC